MTEEKRKNDQINTVGWRWYGKWVLLHLIAAAGLGFGQKQMLDAINASFDGMASLAIEGIVIVVSAMIALSVPLVVTTYALPYPIQHGWKRWLGYGLVAAFIGVAILNVLSIALYPLGRPLANFIITVFITGTAQWLVLRNYVANANRWYGILLGSATLTAMITIFFTIVSAIPVANDTMTYNTQWGINLFLTTFPTSLITGVGLWWLVANHAYTDEKAKREGVS